MRKYLCLIIFLSFVVNIFSIEVDKTILESFSSNNIEFDNYVGPYLFYNSVEEIRSIGSYLANNIDISTKSSSNYNDKYKMGHRPKVETEDERSSYDVFEITNSALIDNSDNIELILSQYLIEAYGYTVDDGDLLAHLILIYNAVYRSNKDYFTKTFTSEIESISQESIGLDIHYYNWAGNTNIIIPLSNKIDLGSLSNVNSDLIIDDNVIENIKVEDPENIEVREDIIDFKEREFDEISENLDDLNRELDIAIEEKNQVENDSIENPIINDSEVVDGSKEITEDPISLENKHSEITDIQEEIKLLQDDLTKKDEKIVELRDNLAEDKNSVLEDKKVSNDEFIKFIVNRENNGRVSGFVANLDSSGIMVNRSNVNSILNNSFIEIDKDLYILAGGDGTNQKVTIGRMNSETLQLVNWANEICYENSPIILKDDYLYVIIEEQEDYFIGEFNRDLVLERVSQSKISKDSYIVLDNNKFYVQGKNNNIELVNLSDFISVE